MERAHQRDEGEAGAAEPLTAPDAPDAMPDAMPADLRRTPESDRAFEEAEPMEGEAPTG